MRSDPPISSAKLRHHSGRRFAPLALALALGTTTTPSPALARPPQSERANAPASPQLLAAIADEVGSKLDDFYASRANRPLWVGDSGITPEARLLLAQLESADLDALKPRKLGARKLRELIGKAESGKVEEFAKVEVALSKAFANYVRSLRKLRKDPMIRESDALKPMAPTPEAALQAAASEPSLLLYLQRMGWMHPLYAPLRKSLADPRHTPLQRQIIGNNLERVRLLPASGKGRHVLVDTASARLWMYEDGKVTDTMRVVVGKAEDQTPMMAGFLRYAIVNPYWNVPEDLVRSRIAANVLAKGQTYLKSSGYQVLSDWSANPTVVDPSLIDWRSVFVGGPAPRVRQLPSKVNFMGKVKFMFPNAQGIYLHDTPDKHLLLKELRQLSSGCVRLENADRFGRWLLGKPLPRARGTPEQDVALPEVVPIYITYLTAMPTMSGIAFHPDVYGHDRAQLALSSRR